MPYLASLDRDNRPVLGATAVSVVLGPVSPLGSHSLDPELEKRYGSPRSACHILAPLTPQSRLRPRSFFGLRLLSSSANLTQYKSSNSQEVQTFARRYLPLEPPIASTLFRLPWCNLPHHRISIPRNHHAQGSIPCTRVRRHSAHP